MNFKQYLQSKDLAQSTIKCYCSEVRYYKQFLLQRGRTPITATKKDLLDYLKLTQRPVGKYRKIVEKQISNKLKITILGTLNHLYTYLVKTEQATHNITQFIKIRGAKKRQLRPMFSIESLHQLCDLLYSTTHQIKQTTIQAHKDYIVLTLTAYQGLRLQEIEQLQIHNFNLHKATINIESTRKTNARILQLEAAQIGILINYFNQYGQTQFIPSRSKIELLHKKLRRLHPKYQDFRQIRGSIITHWIKIHGLRKAQYMAGHRYISSTENYRHNDFEQLQKDLNNFHPLT